MFIAYGGYEIVSVFSTVSAVSAISELTAFASDIAPIITSFFQTYVSNRSRQAIIAGIKSYVAYLLIDATLRVVLDLSPDFTTALGEVDQQAALLQGSVDGLAAFIDMPNLDMSLFQALGTCAVGMTEAGNNGTSQIDACLFNALVSMIVSSSGNVVQILIQRVKALGSKSSEFIVMLKAYLDPNDSFFDNFPTTAVGSFKKLTTKSSLSTSLFNSLDNALASAPSIKFNYGSKTLQSPKQFLNATGSDMYDIVLSNGAYAKFDKTTGRMLYSDGTNQFFVRYTTGNNVTNVEQLINSRVTQLRNCLGLNGNQTVQLTQGFGSVTTNLSKVTTFIGKTDETQLLKNQFGDFKHIEIGETAGSVNLLNMPEPYFNGATWFNDYNQDWMLRGVNRGDDFYIASEINVNTLYNKKSDNSLYGSYYANELNELVTAGIKPKNISQTNWDNLTNQIIQAAATKY